MPKTIRFHLDENCTKAIAVGLRRHGIEVTTTPEVGLLGATDEEQAAFARLEGRVIFTQDRDFLRIHAAGVPHAGIAYCEKDTRSIGEVIAALVLSWEVYEPDEMRGRVEYI
jgi:predicted nuclease of predicted toxin-antitoxin system